MAFGTAIILRVSGSTGGTDLVSYIAREYKPTIQMGKTIILIDTFIVAIFL